MKNRRKELAQYRQLRVKIFVQTVLMAVAAVFLPFFGYMVFLEGRLANILIHLIGMIFRMDYDAAYNAYDRLIRTNIDIVYFLIVAVILIIMFLFYLRWFTKYFYEINRGIDALVNEESGEIILSREMYATERKLNAVRRTLEQRKLDAQLAEQRKNDLIVYLAHDLKTPLTSVLGYLTLLRDENQISEELREKYLSISLDKAERLEDLINEFFEITRFNLTNIELEQSKINLTRMLEQIIFEFQPMFAEKDLHCTLHAAPDLMIKCDVDKMQRVFDNLLRNAVNYSFEGSQITVEAAQVNQNVKITVSNHGNTIPEEKLNRIFEQFYRLDASRTSKSGGAGLGLAIAKEIVELHGGTIAAGSMDEKIIFEVEIPDLLKGQPSIRQKKTGI